MIWLEPTFAAAAVLIADQISKALVMSRTATSVREGPIYSIQHVINRRGIIASFGGRTTLLAIWAVSITAAALVLHCGILVAGTLGSIGIGVAIGGATGNLFDQLRRGAIVDFIAIGRWPAFNVADAAIVSGTGLALLSIR